MKDEDSLMTTCATATLELGIDIGKLERAFQIDAPFTVSGFYKGWGGQDVEAILRKCGL